MLAADEDEFVDAAASPASAASAPRRASARARPSAAAMSPLPSAPAAPHAAVVGAGGADAADPGPAEPALDAADPEPEPTDLAVKQEPVETPSKSSRPSKRYSTPGGMVSFAAEAAPTPAKEEPEGPVQRLIMTKMVLVNFKSYAGRIEVGPFHQSFTSIVGPNGSGKSNVIDALLFVFGWAAKKLRHSKVEHLIHNSAKHPNLPSCSVEVYFEEIVERPGLPSERVPGSELVVSRTGTRSGGSQYHINGRSRTREEVRDAMKAKGVDLDHNRFLILQGEVESIALMPPKGKNENEEGLLEYLEDIIGTNVYKETIETKVKELEELNEERQERLNRVRIVEKERNALEGRKNEAEAFLRTENDLTKHRNKLWQHQASRARKAAESLGKEVAALEETLAAEREKHRGLQETVAEAEKKFEVMKREYETLGKKAIEAQEEMAKAEKEDIRLSENLKHLKTKAKKLEKALEKDKHSIVELETTIQNCEDDMAKGARELEQLTAAKAKEEKALEEIRESLKGKTEVFQQQIEKKQRELAPWLEKIGAAQGRLDVCRSEHEILEGRTSAVHKAKEQAKADDAQVAATLKEKEAELKDLHKKKTKLSGKTDEYRRNLEAQAQENALKERVLKARQKCEEARFSMQAATSRSQVISILMKERDSGRLKGIFGRLGDLGTIEDKYDVAISSAVPQLDQIVVADVETAQKCIEVLKQKNGGRATFITLDKLAQKDMSPVDTPEGVSRLFDLIKPKDAKFLPAFFFVIENTLVASNMEQANRIAYGKQRWRVVTLDGQLIDKAGTMTGGGSKPSRGLMSSKPVSDGASQTEVASLESAWQEEEDKLKQLQGIMAEIQGQIDKIDKELPAIGMALSKIAMEIKSLHQQKADIAQKLVDLEQQTPDEADIQRMKELSKQMAGHEQEIATLKKSSSKIEDGIKELQEKIMEVGGVRLRSQQAKVDGMNSQIDALNDQATKLKVSQAAAEKNIQKARKAVEKSEQELEETNTKRTEIETEKEQKTQIAIAVKARCEEAQKLMDVKKAQLDEIKVEVDEADNAIKKLRKMEVEMTAQMEEKKREQTSNDKAVAHWQRQLKELTLQKLGLSEEEDQEELPTFADEDLEDLDVAAMESEMADMEATLESAQPNLGVLAEYKQRQEEYEARVTELVQATLARDAVKEVYDGLRKRRLEEFMKGFTAISLKLKEMYQMITLGGNTELELVDSLDPFSEGVIFSVMPPKKSWKNIQNLSGGEKTLSSLALVFALHHFKPTPLYVMDEIDAALDFRNVSIVANYIKERTKNAQFVIISLRNNMFELADRLVGIYKTDSCTKTVAINPFAENLLRPLNDVAVQ
ncbi:hypothetical protein DFJ74DRAFT_176515 [Hyaloraphidium curvatum]|nr:hypothetical protein DFJ74DRAFT_176515 [Hyaloraphidium curvatum]